MSLNEKAFRHFLDKRFHEAKTLYLRTCRQDPGDVEARFMLGIIDAQHGDVVDAERWFHEAALIEPQSAAIACRLGDTLQESDNTATAEIVYREVLRFNADFVEAHAKLGVLLRRQGKFNEALKEIGAAVHLAPADWEAHFELGNTLKEMGRFAEAEGAFRESSRLNPDLAKIHESLGFVLFSLRRFRDSVASLCEAIRLQPDYAKAYYYLGEALRGLGRLEEAVAAYGEVIRLKPDHVNSWVSRAFLMTELGSLEEALEAYRQAQLLDPQCATAAVGEAWIFEKKGDFVQAYQCLQPFLEAEHPDVFAALVFSRLCRPLGRCDEAIVLLERILDQGGASLAEPQRAILHHALGRLYDGKNLFDAAFRHIAQGNALKTRISRFDKRKHIREIDALIQTYNPDFLARAPRPKNRSERPVFIIGMPRSGTSVIEQILASHPEVHGGGELGMMNSIVKDLPGILGHQKNYPYSVNMLTQAHVDQLAQRYLEHINTHSQDAARVTDKMPTNFLHLGLIGILFPEARVIHCIRNPLDTCLSCYFQNFGPWESYSHDLRSLGVFYRQYLRLMEHWRAVLDVEILDIEYEELVANQEEISRKMVAYCGLEWDERCLRFYNSKRTVATSSHDQVRQPIYKRSVGRWKNYDAYLEPLKEGMQHIWGAVVLWTINLVAVECKCTLIPKLTEVIQQSSPLIEMMS